jgi:hypothetical protein
MRDLVAEPAKEFLQFEAALSLLPVLPPDEAVTLLRERALRVSENITTMRAQVTQLSSMTFRDFKQPDDQVPAPLLGQKFPPIFLVETEHRLALLQAELDFVNGLVRRITEDGWGPVDLWRGMQMQCEQGFRRESIADEAATVAVETVS